MESENVSFRLGEIEYLPVADGSVDVILSNCVINLSPDKEQVWREAYRVLKAGGRLSISDVVATAPMPDEIKENLSFLTGCVSGAEEVDILRSQLAEAGFTGISITSRDGSEELIGTWFPESGAEQFVASAMIEAYKPDTLHPRIPQNPDWVLQISEKAADNMRRHDNCTQSIVSAFLDSFTIDDPLLMRGASGFLGGMTASLTCGIHSAGVIVLGLLMGRQRLEHGADGLYPVVAATQDLIKRLNEKLGSDSCRELTGTDFTNLRQAASFRGSEEYERCIDRVREGAGEIAAFISEIAETGELFQPGEITAESKLERG